MATKHMGNDFIRFVLAAEADKELLLEFLAKEKSDDLFNFFQKKGFKDISKEECESILQAQKPPKAMQTLGEIIIHSADSKKGY
jgi:hypothetical protein